MQLSPGGPAWQAAGAKETPPFAGGAPNEKPPGPTLPAPPTAGADIAAGTTRNSRDRAYMRSLETRVGSGFRRVDDDV